MADKYINKVIIGNDVKLDLTADDITADKLAKGIKAHDKSGAPIVGTSTFDSDTSGDTAVAAEILLGKTAHAKGAKLVGTMPNQGGKTLDITDKAAPVSIPMGLVGTMSGSEGMKAQAKNATPTFAQQEILPDEGYNCLSSVTVAAIPVSYTDNEQGGQTLKVGV